MGQITWDGPDRSRSVPLIKSGGESCATSAANAAQNAAIAAFATRQLVVLNDGIKEALKTASKSDPEAVATTP